MENMKNIEDIDNKVATVYQVSPDTSTLMNCYIIRTKSGKLIVIDGGGKDSRENNEGYLYGELQKISGKKNPEVEAWFLSHMHDDHVMEFCRIGKNKNLPITVKNVYFNFPERKYFKTAMNGRYEYLYDELSLAYDRFFGDGAFLRCNAKTAFEGDVFEIDGLKIEIMLTHPETMSPEEINDTTMIFSVTAEGQRILFLGDAYKIQEERLLYKYGADLKSDIVQMSHHGQHGFSEKGYNAIDPKLCLWPSPDWVFDNWNGNLYTFDTRKWIVKMGVKHHFITGRHKTQSFSFPVEFDTLPMEDIFVYQKS